MGKEEDSQLYYCTTCKKTLRGVYFYTSNNREKYPNNGKLNECKDCVTRHVDNWNPDTFLPILEEIDVPYVPTKWNELLLKYGQNAKAVKGTTIIGRYVGQMRLNQFTKYRWKDTEYLQKVKDNERENILKLAGKDTQEIEEIIKKDKEMPERPADYDKWVASEQMKIVQSGRPALSVNTNSWNSDAEDDDIDLTEEEKTMLRLKWGKMYRPSEWVQLEQFYAEMINSYDIQTAGHKDTLKMICKTSLKANQLIDLGD